MATDKGRRINGIMLKILKWVLANVQSDFSKYLLALTLAFRRDFIDLSNPSAAGRLIFLYLQEILNKTYDNESEGLRRQLSAIALLEIGADKKWEGVVLSYQENDIWKDLPRINNLVNGITDYNPADERIL